MIFIRTKNLKGQQYDLTGSIHTMNIKTEGVMGEASSEVARCIRSIVTGRTDTVTSCIINANNLMGDLFTYEQFQTAVNTIVADVGITKYWTTRVDMRFDSYDKEYYLKYAKLNRLLISMVAVTYNIKNRYKTVDLFSEQQLSVAIKTDEFEIENYDKERESSGCDKAKSRFELRSKRMRGKDIGQEFLVVWPKRWGKSLKNFSKVGERYNEELVRIYREGSTAFPKKFSNLTDFLLQYQNCIFTKEQMIDFFKQIGVKNPQIKYQNHKQRYGIELFSIDDVSAAIEEINRATRQYFEISKMIEPDRCGGLQSPCNEGKNANLKIVQTHNIDVAA